VAGSAQRRVLRAVKRDGYTPWIQSKTGLVPDSYFSATIIMWILDHV
jgi:glycerol kinase